jgi:Bacterial regulatory proteins, tetR family
MASRADDRRLQERSLATRAALLDAAIECLIDRGYAATTTIETARRAHGERPASDYLDALKSVCRLARLQTEGSAHDDGSD